MRGIPVGNWPAVCRVLALAVLVNLLGFAAANAAEGRAASLIEYRLEALPDAKGAGETVRWAKSDQTRVLESAPFMGTADIAKASIVPAINNPGKFSIELVHTKAGMLKFRTVGNKDRDRQYMVVFEGQIIQGYSFPPEQKGLYDRGNTIYGGFTREEATAIAGKINEAVRASGPARP